MFINHKLIKMKKLFISIIFITTFSVSAQTSARFYNMNVKSGHAESVLNIFNDFNEGAKWKPGSGVMLQRVMFKNDVTHRIITWGDPENWGSTTQKTSAEWRAYLEKMNNHRDPSVDSAIVTSYGFTDGDIEGNPTAKVFDIHIHEPAKFKAAFDILVKQNQSIIGNRRMGLIQYDAGGTPGATHGIVVYGKNINDLVIIERRFRDSEGFSDYLKNRGKVEYKLNYIVNTLSRSSN